MNFDSLLDYNAEKFFQPASNNKLLATSLAYKHLGGNAQFQTSFLTNTARDTLCITGTGDPSTTYSVLDAALQKLRGGGLQFQTVGVDMLWQRGIEDYPDSWEIGDLVWYYGAQPTVLVLNENTATLVVNASTPVGSQPRIVLAEAMDANSFDIVNNVVVIANGTTSVQPQCAAFQNGLVLEGTIVAGTAMRLTAAVPQPNLRYLRVVANYLNIPKVTVGCPLGVNWNSLFTLKSPSFSPLLNWTLQTSDNLYAEEFFKATMMFLNQSQPISYALASAVMRAHLPPSVAAGAYPVDGSGLSRHNLLSPNALRSLFENMYSEWTSAQFAEFVSFLPTAGQSGTLINRFHGGAAEGVLHAKTGGMTGVSSLSGVIIRKNYPVVAFSFIINQSTRSSLQRNTDIDAICNLLAQLT